MKTLFTYDATTRRAKIFSRNRDVMLCDVTDVSSSIAGMLDKLAEESFHDGLAAGRRSAIAEIADRLERMT